MASAQNSLYSHQVKLLLWVAYLSTYVPTNLPTYLHARTNNVYKRKGVSREFWQGILLKMSPQIVIAPCRSLGEKRKKT